MRWAHAATKCAFANSVVAASGDGTQPGAMSPDCVDIRHTLSYDWRVKPFRWSPEKNELLRTERGVAFEQVVVAIDEGGLLDVLTHPNPERYPRQRVAVVAVDGYAMLVPYVEAEDHLFLKSVIPSRKATRDYLGGPSDD